MAIWVGGDEQIFNRRKPVLDAMGDQASCIGPIGAGSIAKLVHNCTSAVMGVALAEVFTMGVKAGGRPGRFVGGGAPGCHRPGAHL
jgi:3-hydroxyisobutyrate dehydrogenase